MKTIQKTFLSLLFLFAITLNSCQKENMNEVMIQKMETFVAKWKPKVNAGKLSENDKKEFMKDSEEISKYADNYKGERPKPTKEEIDKLSNLGMEIAAITMKSGAMDFPMPQ